MLNLIKGVIMYLPNKVIQMNSFAGSVAGLPTKVDKILTFWTKLIGATTGTAGIAKGTSDVMVALKDCDHVCAVISGIGVSADMLQVATTFVSGPNVTMVLTTPISVGCKTFVWCCRRGKLFWGGC
jgi:hypothetical protein